MKCPKCVELGLKSEVRSSFGGLTLHQLCPIPDNFYDYDGKLHSHVEKPTYQYECSNKHYWKVGGELYCQNGACLIEYHIPEKEEKKSLIQHIKEFFCGS